MHLGDLFFPCAAPHHHRQLSRAVPWGGRCLSKLQVCVEGMCLTDRALPGSFSSSWAQPTLSQFCFRGTAWEGALGTQHSSCCSCSLGHGISPAQPVSTVRNHISCTGQRRDAHSSMFTSSPHSLQAVADRTYYFSSYPNCLHRNSFLLQSRQSEKFNIISNQSANKT